MLFNGSESRHAVEVVGRAMTDLLRCFRELLPTLSVWKHLPKPYLQVKGAVLATQPAPPPQTVVISSAPSQPAPARNPIEPTPPAPGEVVMWTSIEPYVKINSYFPEKIDGKEVMLYHVNVFDGSRSWGVDRRFQAFHDLHDRLESAYPHMKLPEPPPKTTLSGFVGFFSTSHDAIHIEERRQQLQDYMNQLMLATDPRDFRVNLTRNSYLLRKFLSIDPLRGQQHRIEVLPDVRELPPPRVSLQIPVSMQLTNGETVVIHSLLDCIKRKLEYLASLKRAVDELPSIESKLTKLENNKAETLAAISELESHMSLLYTLTNDPYIKSDGFLRSYLRECLTHVDNAFQWATRVEDHTVEYSSGNYGISDSYQAMYQVPNSPDHPQLHHTYVESNEEPDLYSRSEDERSILLESERICSIDARVAQLEADAEKLVLQSLGGDGSSIESSLKQTKKQIKKLLEQIAHEITGLGQQSATQSYRDRLQNATIYLQNTLSSFSKVEIVDQVPELEQSMFDLVSRSQGIHPNEGPEASEIYAEIEKLSKRLANYKMSLEKKENCAGSINRIEDLQENLTDFAHSWRKAKVSKVDIRGWHTSKQVANAMKAHADADDDLFGL